MDITPLIPEHNQIIQSYGPGKFKVNGVIYTQSIIITPEHTRKWDVPAHFEDLQKEHLKNVFTILADTPVDLVLLGTGEKGHFLSPDLLRIARSNHISPETMNTGAACRTYNVLMAEGRRIAACLFVL